jgi:hypothetical protein
VQGALVEGVHKGDKGLAVGGKHGQGGLEGYWIFLFIKKIIL